jgi:(1->4)-alpha-D-glucan 1-alpha-D-glucosylmutase
LALRKREAAVFADGGYTPCEVVGPRADELVAYARRRGGRVVVTAVQRFAVRAERGDWGGTAIRLPRDAAGAVDVLTGRAAHGAALDPQLLFATLPIAVLAPPNGHGEA